MIIKYNILTVRCFNKKRVRDLQIQPIDARLAAVYSIAVKLYRSSAERKHPSLQCKIWIHLIKSWGPDEESSWKLMSSGCSAGWRVITLQYVCILWMGFDEVVILNRGNKFVSWVPCLFSFSLFKMKGRPWLGIFRVYRGEGLEFLFWNEACEVTEWNLRENQRRGILVLENQTKNIHNLLLSV